MLFNFEAEPVAMLDLTESLHRTHKLVIIIGCVLTSEARFSPVKIKISSLDLTNYVLIF